MIHLISVIILLLNAIAVHSFFYINNLQMVKFPSDSTTQFVYFKYLIQQSYQDGHFLWSWVYGIGGDLFSQFNYYYSTAFIWLVSLLGENVTLIDVLEQNVLFAMLKVFLASVFMYVLILKGRRSVLAAMMAALIYSGSYVFAIHSFEFDFMTDSFVLLPLWILAFNRYLETNKPYFFVVVTAIVLINNFYFAYILTVYFTIYCAYKYFDFFPRYNWQSVFIYSRNVVLYYLLGMMLAAFSFLPAVYQFLSSDRLVKEHFIPKLYSANFYENVPQLLFFSYNTTHSVGISLQAAFILLAGILLLPNKQYLPKKILLAVLFVMFLIPYVYSVMNGFSAPQKRWLFLLVFTFSYVTGHFFDDVIAFARKKLTLTFGTLLVLFAIYMWWRAEYNEAYLEMDIRFYAMTAVVLGVTIWKRRVAMAVAIVAMLLASNVMHSFIYYDAVDAQYSAQSYSDYFDSVAFGNDESQQIVNTILQNESPFSRTIFTKPEFFLNSGMYYGLKTNMAYQSLIPKNVHRFYKEHYNTYSEVSSSVSKYRGYDDRLYLEAMMANEWKVTRKDEPAPYYYEKFAETEHYFIYKMPQHLQLGYAIAKGNTVSPERFSKLTMAERDQLALTGVVIEGAETNEALIGSLQVAEQSILPTDLIVEGGVLDSNYTVTISESHGTITIPYERQFANSEVLVELHMKEEQTQVFTMSVEGKTLEYPGTSIWNFPMQHLIVSSNLPNDAVTIQLTAETYAFGEIRIVENSYAPFQQYMSQLAQTTLTDISYEGNHVSAEFTVDKPSHYVMALPYSKGWTLKVDGKKVPIYEVNHMLIGFDVDEGTHRIELMYVTPGLRIAGLTSLFAILILIIHYTVRRYKSK